MSQAERREVPFVVVVFTCLVCTGIMANFTIVLPLLVYWNGGMLADAGIISSYAVGAIVSLTFWAKYDSSSVKLCYITHAVMMIIGNILFAFVPNSNSSLFAWFARFILGLEGGAMYNANLALISLSSPTTRVKYLAMYQSFVGFGLVLGPAISATTTAIAILATAHPDSLRTVLAACFMAIWGICLLLGLLIFMPDDASLTRSTSLEEENPNSKETPLDPSIQSEGSDSESSSSQDHKAQAYVLFLAFSGNLMRIFQRLAWEVGAIVLLAEYFHWGAIAAGYSLATFGVLQIAAQYYYGQVRRSQNLKINVRDLKRFETLELIAICALFTKTNASHNWRTFFNVTFVLASLLFYLASCLTSAPLNDLLLVRSTKAGLYEKAVHAHKKTLLAMQYGIFVAFFLAPIAARAVLHIGGLNTTSIAGLLALGSAFQTATNSLTIGRIGSRRPVVIAILITVFMLWCSFDITLGGTGPRNIFTYHPVAMTIAFYFFMTPGHFVYRKDAQFLTTGNFYALFSKPDDETTKEIDRSQQRRAHLFYLATATFFAFLGYICIFAAHYQSGESQIGIGENTSRTAHVALGYTCLLWLVVQSMTGSLKYNTLASGGPPSFTWHGLSGKYLLLLAYITTCLGFWLHMNYSNQGGWNLGIKLTLSAGAVSLFAYRAFPDSMHPPAGIDQDTDDAPQEQSPPNPQTDLA